MNKTPAVNNDYIWEPFDGELVLLNLSDGKQHLLNSVASSFFKKIDGKRSVIDIIELMLAEFVVERQLLEKDLETLIQNLVEKGIIELNETDKHGPKM